VKPSCTGAPGFGKATQSCCSRHDADYAAGSKISRLEADTLLLLCVAEAGRPWRACAMFIVCRLFGWIFYRGKA
jgi:hypothetical protein